MEELYKHLWIWEGGKYGAILVKGDKGGWTNAGVTLATWQTLAPKLFGIVGNLDTLKKMSYDQWKEVVNHFYQTTLANQINSPMIAALVVDGVYWSGSYFTEYDLQPALNELGQNIKVDGVIGNKTIAAINAVDPSELFELVNQKRWRRLRGFAVANPDQYKFLYGWHNRIRGLANDFQQPYPEPAPLAYLRKIDPTVIKANAPDTWKVLQSGAQDPPNIYSKKKV